MLSTFERALLRLGRDDGKLNIPHHVVQARPAASQLVSSRTPATLHSDKMSSVIPSVPITGNTIAACPPMALVLPPTLIATNPG